MEQQEQIDDVVAEQEEVNMMTTGPPEEDLAAEAEEDWGDMMTTVEDESAVHGTFDEFEEEFVENDGEFHAEDWVDDVVCTEFFMFDSYGDGWNDNYFMIYFTEEFGEYDG